MSDDIQFFEHVYFIKIIAASMIILFGISSLISFYLSFSYNVISLNILIFQFLWVINTICWIIIFFQLRNNDLLTTTKDKIIIPLGSKNKPLEIYLSEIEKIERKSLSKIEIWYRDRNAIVNKQKFNLFHFKKEDQIKFNNYIENIKVKKIPPAISNKERVAIS